MRRRLCNLLAFLLHQAVGDPPPRVGEQAASLTLYPSSRRTRVDVMAAAAATKRPGAAITAPATTGGSSSRDYRK